MNDLAANDRCYRPTFEGPAVKRGIARFARRFLHAVSPRTIQRKNGYIRWLSSRQFAFFTQDARGAASEKFHHTHQPDLTAMNQLLQGEATAVSKPKMPKGALSNSTSLIAGSWGA